ncbi:DGQHR domain-containing protein [Aeromonas sp. FDAARGOS 1408]|uniref:DGQHR domain-containing protein n=1 Tax=Aeromonas TaxID=642 RepID=UPI001C22E417|nr:DGQHR domain-containing protein [Aeromonas sp. FDAARGOS 1408]QXC10192.1 DGQHR domain-containing protein [Aeromonas sp. FDAARGOS 1408]
MKVKYLSVKQPIGNFYLTSIDASILAKFADATERGESPDAVQREQSATRIKEISEYCSDTDATFPTPIIIAVNLSADVNIDEDYIYFDENSNIGDVIDGQHRLKGLMKSKYINDFQLPVVFMFDLEPYQKAYVFSIINSKQTRVNMSLIYDLFALSKTRSPYKTCHEIARALNKDPESPFYRRLKMLGKKEKGQDAATLSQGTFIKYFLELISKNPDKDSRDIKREISLNDDPSLPLRRYFISEADAVIHKIILNLFSGLRDVFRKEWEDPNGYILSKSIGFGAIIKIFPQLYMVGAQQNDLSREFFADAFKKIKNNLDQNGTEITSENYGSNEQARAQLAADLLNAYEA